MYAGRAPKKRTLIFVLCASYFVLGLSTFERDPTVQSTKLKVQSTNIMVFQHYKPAIGDCHGTTDSITR
jgi:hypothetical protein